MDQSGETKEEKVIGEGIGESEVEELVIRNGGTIWLDGWLEFNGTINTN